jgi:hypothetical protein
MRLSDLLGAEVVDEQGHSAGRVHDLRLEQDGPMIGGFGASLRLAGLLVGRRAVGARFGYERPSMKGPLLVKLLVGWLGQDAGYAAWDRVKAIEPGRVVIAGSADDLPHPRPVSQGPYES